MKTAADYDIFKIFAHLHPVEAYESRPKDFMQFMDEEGYGLSEDQVKEIILNLKT